MRPLSAVLLSLFVGIAPACAALPQSSQSLVVPTLIVTPVAGGLDHAWDVKAITDTKWLITERSGGLWLYDGGNLDEVSIDLSDVWVSGEGGLMSLELDPDFSTSQRFYTCTTWTKSGGGHDVRVVAWTLNEGTDPVTAIFDEVVVKGFPASSGRHSGCRLLIDERNGSLWVGTGDAAKSGVPRNLTSLGGKVLHLNPLTGAPWPSNPFINASNKNKRFISSYGHRNIQGLAQRSDGKIWQAEHGTDVNDEINLNINGGDYGWNPGPGYNESVPMTDHSLPGKQIDAKWTSGPTPAASGITFVYGSGWGSLDGTLAVACLQGEKVMFMKFDGNGKLVSTRTPDELTEHGRLRSVIQLPSGDLLFTTDNEGGTSVIRVAPVL